jgi:hypothetical protein
VGTAIFTAADVLNLADMQSSYEVIENTLQAPANLS